MSDAPNFSRPAAFALAAAIMLVPANYLPILTTSSTGETRTDTIYSGMMGLYESGLWPLAIIVATASLIVPFAKLIGLVCLILAARRGRSRHARTWTRVYATLEAIGRWSMLDVFLVAFLTSAVQFGALSSIRPQPGIFAFAAAVVLTILATQAFDPRLLWRETDPAASASPAL
jgi:paraquat-inducible protein A